jgi:hypothetical protein
MGYGTSEMGEGEENSVPDRGSGEQFTPPALRNNDTGTGNKVPAGKQTFYNIDAANTSNIHTLDESKLESGRQWSLGLHNIMDRQLQPGRKERPHQDEYIDSQLRLGRIVYPGQEKYRNSQLRPSNQTCRQQDYRTDMSIQDGQYPCPGQEQDKAHLDKDIAPLWNRHMDPSTNNNTNNSRQNIDAETNNSHTKQDMEQERVNHERKRNTKNAGRLYTVNMEYEKIYVATGDIDTESNISKTQIESDKEELEYTNKSARRKIEFTSERPSAGNLLTSGGDIPRYPEDMVEDMILMHMYEQDSDAVDLEFGTQDWNITQSQNLQPAPERVMEALYKFSSNEDMGNPIIVMRNLYNDLMHCINTIPENKIYVLNNVAILHNFKKRIPIPFRTSYVCYIMSRRNKGMPLTFQAFLHFVNISLKVAEDNPLEWGGRTGK